MLVSSLPAPGKLTIAGRLRRDSAVGTRLCRDHQRHRHRQMVCVPDAERRDHGRDAARYAFLNRSVLKIEI